jgi:phage protein D
MPANVTLVMSPKMLVNGVNMELNDLIDLRVEQSVSMPSQLTLRFRDADFRLIDSDRFAIGAELAVTFVDSVNSSHTVFDGEIVTIGSEQDIERIDACQLVVTALDRAHRLGHNTRIRTFQQQKYSDVVKKIAQEEGLRAEVEDTRIKFPYLMQTTTNYAFLNELAFRAGCEWQVEGKSLRFGQRTSGAAPVVTYGVDIRRLKTRFSAADGTNEVKVSSWDPLTKREIVGSAKMSTVRSQAPSITSTAPLGTKGRTDGRSFVGNVGTSALIATSTEEANGLATALGRRIAASELTTRCVCIGRPDVVAGGLVELAGVGTRLSGTSYVTSVEHYWGQDTDLTTTFQAGGQEPSSLVDLLGGSPNKVDDFGRIGLTIGIVTNNKDPDGLGRVRVKFPHLSSQEESWWGRIVTPGAGTDTGLMFLPQIDDEVLVGFEHGDLRRPLVLGGLWGSKAKPPTASDVFLEGQKVVEWGFKTLGSHALTIRSGQKPADKHFKVKLADGTLLYLGSDKTEIIAQHKTLELKSGQASVLLTDKGDVELRGANITIKATSALKLEGLSIDVKASTTMKAEGSTAIELKGGASAKLEASGIAEVKGAMVKIN